MTKFDLIDFGDEKSSKLAEIMKNKKCKKILDYLKKKEASETEIAKALKLPLSTIHYNLQKLIESDLIEVKDFYWSPKGNKVNIYKTSNKVFIFSQKKSPYLENKIRMILPLIAIISLAIILSIIFLYPQESDIQINKFNSLSEIGDFVKENTFMDSGIYQTGIGGNIAFASGGVTTFASTDAITGGSTGSSSPKSSVDFSETNIQIEGVDEADIVKTDGNYIYIVNAKQISIIDASSPESAKIITEIEVEGVNEIFINENKLIAFTQSNVFVYDVNNKENPILEQDISLDGTYIDSRMIEDHVYIISTKHINMDNIIPPIYRINGFEKTISPNEIYYFDFPDRNYVFTSIVAINVNNLEFDSKVYLTGATQNIYVSQDNIYLTHTKKMNQKDLFKRMIEEVLLPLLPSSERSQIKTIINSGNLNYEKLQEIETIIVVYMNSLKGDEKANFDKKLMENIEKFQRNIMKEMEKTFIHKINLDELDIEYITSGEVNGYVLNQFSMDEYKDNFRIATTTGRWRNENLNHIYVLNEDLKVVGSVEDLAEGERIYSARFLGKRAYLVTFRQVDPLFVIDLSIPKNPKVLGELKIPGYSDYLHPYDKDHIIGIGKEADEGGMFQGVKMALFDIRDVENPIELHKEIIGDRGTDSEVLRDHKAFLFDREKDLFVLPINLVLEELHLQGAYVYKLTLEEGFELRGKITHYETSRGGSIKRSFYIEDALYTLSSHKIMTNSLNTLEKIKEIEIGAIKLFECGVLNIENEFYKLQNDITTSGTCFTINANNIILDLNGHNIVGEDNGQGVYIENYNGLIVRNGGISNFAEGIRIIHSSDNIISDIHFLENNGGQGGIDLENSNNNLIKNNHVEKGLGGIQLLNSNYNILKNNHVEDHKIVGIDLARGSNNNIIENNLVEKNLYGIYLGEKIDVQGKNNEVRNNTLIQNSRGSITDTDNDFNIVVDNIIL